MPSYEEISEFVASIENDPTVTEQLQFEYVKKLINKASAAELKEIALMLAELAIIRMPTIMRAAKEL